MWRADSRSFLEKLVGVCFSLLLAAVALYEAIQLIERVWIALVVIICVVTVLVGVIALLGARHHSW